MCNHHYICTQNSLITSYITPVIPKKISVPINNNCPQSSALLSSILSLTPVLQSWALVLFAVHLSVVNGIHSTAGPWPGVTVRHKLYVCFRHIHIGIWGHLGINKPQYMSAAQLFIVSLPGQNTCFLRVKTFMGCNQSSIYMTDIIIPLYTS